MDRIKEARINVGGSLIILIIVVFALSIFSVLSIKASNSDLVLAKKTRESVEKYYEADAKAQQIVMQIDGVLSHYFVDLSDVSLKKQLQEVVENIGEVDATSDKAGSISYHIDMGGSTYLEVVLSYNIEQEDQNFYEIEKWEVDQSE